MKAFVRRFPWFAATSGILVLGAAWWLVGPSEARDTGVTWLFSLWSAVVAIRSVGRMVRRLRAGSVGVDLLAVLAIASTALVGEYVAAVIVVLMLTGGEALESAADARARNALDALLHGAPRLAHRRRADGEIEDLPADEVQVGDVLLVRPGELVPVDGRLDSAAGSFDESTLTGESLPVEHRAGAQLLSGSVNGSDAITLTALATADDSQYQAIVALVNEAQRSPAPMVRLADRFAVPFTVVALLIAGAAWAWSADPLRFAQVLVLATPCPLLIAAPVAYIGGLGRAARAGVIVKGGAALEVLGRARTVVFDKTGTLTSGRVSIERIVPAPGMTEAHLLATAAAAEQYSTHVFAQAILERARHESPSLPTATGASEHGTDGVTAIVAGVPVFVGKPDVAARGCVDYAPIDLDVGESGVAVVIDGRFAGTLVVTDPVRSETADTLVRLRRSGIDHVELLSGDAARTVARVAAELGLDDYRAGCRPGEKVEAVRAAQPRPVIMVGDGVNDAPALAAADVGIAMGARGSTAAGEAADVVILLDDLSRIADAVEIGRRSTRIAVQSIWLGIGLSVVLMIIATTGRIPAVAGALLQEAIDVATILGALRAAVPGRPRPREKSSTVGAALPSTVA